MLVCLVGGFVFCCLVFLADLNRSLRSLRFVFIFIFSLALFVPIEYWIVLALGIWKMWHLERIG